MQILSVCSKKVLQFKTTKQSLPARLNTCRQALFRCFCLANLNFIVHKHEVYAP